MARKVGSTELPPPPKVVPDGNEPPGLVAFLRQLLRDAMPTGEVERLVVHTEGCRRDHRLGSDDDDPLARLAATYARRILGPAEEPVAEDAPAEGEQA